MGGPIMVRKSLVLWVNPCFSNARSPQYSKPASESTKVPSRSKMTFVRFIGCLGHPLYEQVRFQFFGIKERIHILQSRRHHTAIGELAGFEAWLKLLCWIQHDFAQRGSRGG